MDVVLEALYTYFNVYSSIEEHLFYASHITRGLSTYLEA